MSLYRDTVSQLSALYPTGEATALARMLFEERFGLSQTDLLLGKDSNLSADDLKEVQDIVARLLKNEPMQYILGYTDFCGLRIGVAPGVLIPRPETQELVEWIVEAKDEMPAPQRLEAEKTHVLDIGTGSGCIALALASKGYDVEAWDVSKEALRIAQANAESLGLSVHFEQKDILQISSTRPHSSSPSIIVSNPPYICQHEAADMERNVLDHEPPIALFVPDNDPLLFYRAIARFAQHNLKPGGFIYFEINRAYNHETKFMLEQEGFVDIELRNDQFGNPRMMKATKPHTQPNHEGRRANYEL